MIAGVALYAGEGTKRDGVVGFANTDPRMLRLFLRWLRDGFDIDESRLRAKLYLHQGLDLDRATEFWSAHTGVPVTQFRKAYRAVPDPSIRTTKHEHGCATVTYACTQTSRSIRGLMTALLS